jgi:hypothetical protein
MIDTGRPRAAHQTLRRFPTVAASLLMAFVVAGCDGDTMKYYAGTKPDTQLLETTLRIGSSTKNDVRAALGAPNGNGRFMLPVVDKSPRDTWTYYFEDSELGSRGGELDWRARRIFLFVYFDRGRYDGFLWFSSLPDARG